MDLQSARTDYNKLLDEELMRCYKLDQLKVNNRTKQNDMAMQIKIAVMKLNRMFVELRNEHYMDSLGAGTADKVRQAELSYDVAKLELEQLRQQYDNERKIAVAEFKVQKLEFSIFKKGLAETKRTLEDAEVRSPRKAVLTYINNQIGIQVQQGSRLAVISDLTHFKVDGEIADSYVDKVTVGCKAIIKIKNNQLEGVISNVTPLSKNGVISFSIQLKDNCNKYLRPGLNADVYVVNAVKDNVMRIANKSFYTGDGNYELFVINADDELVKRKVKLGDSNSDYVEVISGLKIGDRVVVNDMSGYKNKLKLKVTL